MSFEIINNKKKKFPQYPLIFLSFVIIYYTISYYFMALLKDSLIVATCCSVSVANMHG